MIPIPIRAFPNRIHIRHGRLEVIIHGNASSTTALNAGRLGQLVPQFDSDGAYGKVRFVRSAVLQRKAAESFVVGAFICRPRELLGGRAVVEDLHAHTPDLAENHFTCVGVELSLEGVGLPVDDAHMGDPVRKNHRFSCELNERVIHSHFEGIDSFRLLDNGGAVATAAVLHGSVVNPRVSVDVSVAVPCDVP